MYKNVCDDPWMMACRLKNKALSGFFSSETHPLHILVDYDYDYASDSVHFFDDNNDGDYK
jgi:hypothetical protein